MSDNDLIRRGDAKSKFSGRGLAFVRSGLDALPAVQPTVKPLRYIEPEGETIDQMRDHARQHPLAQAGDMRLVWVNEGDLHMHTIFHAAQPTVKPLGADGVTIHPQDILNAAWRDDLGEEGLAMYARILSALGMQPTVSPDVAALVEALEFYAAWEMEEMEPPTESEIDLFDGILNCPMPKALSDRGEIARAALARVKGAKE